MLISKAARGLRQNAPVIAAQLRLASFAQAAPLLAVVDHVQLLRASQSLPALASLKNQVHWQPAQLRGFAAPSRDEEAAPGKQQSSTRDARQVPSAEVDPEAEAEAEAAGAERMAERAAEDGQSILAHREIDKDTYWLMQPVYKKEYVESVKPKHLPPNTARQRLAYWAIQVVRTLFDKVTGYGPNMNEALWLRRIVFLETVAGVPGMVGGMLRHMASLRQMRRDHGWIHTLLEEAENERMHLLTFLTLRQPGVFFRSMVLVAQGMFFNFFFLTYLVSPRYCHAFVGYLEEEAVKTYTHAIADLDAGKLPQWEKLQAPDVAKKYWKLAPDAGMRELLLAVRADEAGHSHVNHTLSQLRKDEPNPFAPGSHAVP